MMKLEDVTIVIATHGDRSWWELAESRALPSAVAQGVAVETLHQYDETLADTRNRVLDRVKTSHVVYLDADDELEPFFVRWLVEGAADLRAPAVRYVRDSIGPDVKARMPRVAGHDHGCTGDCLPFGNWLVVGSLAPVNLIRAVGGWREWPAYEDWDLWLRCWQAGATVEAIPRAIYKAHVRPDSRNRAGTAQERHEAHRQIAAANGVPVP